MFEFKFRVENPLKGRLTRSSIISIKLDSLLLNIFEHANVCKKLKHDTNSLSVHSKQSKINNQRTINSNCVNHKYTYFRQLLVLAMIFLCFADCEYASMYSFIC